MLYREPFIGVTCDVQIPKRKVSAYELLCDHRYPEAVKKAGGYPVLLPMAPKQAMINRYLDGIDGLIIVGGDDVDPRLYGEECKSGTGTVFKPRLDFERKLYREARRRRMPIFGICYGMQLINVLEGGTLFQDIRRDAKSTFRHRYKKWPFHRVEIDANSHLYEIVGQHRAMVHSDHHQAVCRLAPGFKPVAFAPDGIIEAIEDESRRIIAVQWHPERSLRSATTKRLFRTFIELCTPPSKEMDK